MNDAPSIRKLVRKVDTGLHVATSVAHNGVVTSTGDETTSMKMVSGGLLTLGCWFI